MSKKRALITGITGQDGSYLAEFLLSKGYDVHGIARRTSHQELSNIQHIHSKIHIYFGDLLDQVSLNTIVKKVMPNEIYNLASQSSPGESFRQPLYTAEVTAIGAHRILEAVKERCPKAKFYQASSSEMFGWVKHIPQDESTPFNPANPYAAAKLYAHNIAKIYRESYGMFVCCGILFNHESPRRGLCFVSQKVAYAAACAKLGIKTSKHMGENSKPIVKNGKVSLGNLHAKRDWGYAGDYVKVMWKMMQLKKPIDLVIATNETHTVAEFCKEAYSYVGLDWKKYVKVEPFFVRPTETGPLIGNYSQAKKILKWKPKIRFKELVAMMVKANIERLS